MKKELDKVQNQSLEETKKVKGQVNIKGTTAYVEQEPYIYSTSIKENILFGKKYDEELF